MTSHASKSWLAVNPGLRRRRTPVSARLRGASHPSRASLRPRACGAYVGRRSRCLIRSRPFMSQCCRASHCDFCWLTTHVRARPSWLLIKELIARGVHFRFPTAGPGLLIMNSMSLLPLLEDWTPSPVEFFLYYPRRRQLPAALQVLIDFLRTEIPNSG